VTFHIAAVEFTHHFVKLIHLKLFIHALALWADWATVSNP
jgi:hypothetical protein